MLPLIHYALLGLSKPVHDLLLEQGYDLFAKTDQRFVEAVYKLLRQEFGYQPQVPPVTHFLNPPPPPYVRRSLR